MKNRKIDPRLQKLMCERTDLLGAWEVAGRKLARAFHRWEKARLRVVRVQRSIVNRERELSAPPATEPASTPTGS